MWARDRGRCTFVSETGHRCKATKGLQFDHVLEVARGGEATVEGLRLRCGPHNQYTAERTFGAEFMRRKRTEAAEARAAARAHGAAEKEQVAARRREREEAAARERAIVEQPHVQEVIPYLRALGCRMDEARRAAERCADMPDASLHDRVHRAVSGLGRGRTCRSCPAD